MKVEMIRCESCGKLAKNEHEALRGWCEIQGHIGFRLKNPRGPCKIWMAYVPSMSDGEAHFCSRKCMNAALDRAETGKEAKS